MTTNTPTMRCPNCQKLNTGKIGSYRYFCWACFIELTVKGDEISMHQVEKDGRLTSLNDLFEERPAATYYSGQLPTKQNTKGDVNMTNETFQVVKSYPTFVDFNKWCQTNYDMTFDEYYDMCKETGVAADEVLDEFEILIEQFLEAV